jgi:hypothetical protein
MNFTTNKHEMWPRKYVIDLNFALPQVVSGALSGGFQVADKLESMYGARFFNLDHSTHIISDNCLKELSKLETPFKYCGTFPRQICVYLIVLVILSATCGTEIIVSTVSYWNSSTDGMSLSSLLSQCRTGLVSTHIRGCGFECIVTIIGAHI